VSSARRILAIRFARLGDVILLLPALSLIKRSFPQAHLSLLTGHRCGPIARMCPAIDEVIEVDRIAIRDGSVWRAAADVKRLLSDIRGRKLDTVIDFHSFRETNLLTWFSCAPQRIGMRRFKAPYLGFCFNYPPVDEDKSVHVSEMFRRVARALPGVDAAESVDRLALHPVDEEWVTTEIPDEPRIAMYVDAPVADRRWPPERFAQLADFVVETMNASPVVLASPANKHLISGVRAASRNPAKLSFYGDLPLPRLAAVIGSAKLLISNDTGPMHLGPALGIPTFGLFSVGLPGHFRPTGERDGFLKAVPIEGISVEDVIRWIQRFPIK